MTVRARGHPRSPRVLLLIDWNVVIDMKGFINALVAIGYDGPVEVEPFDQELSKIEPDAAVRATAESLDRVWGLIAT